MGPRKLQMKPLSMLSQQLKKGRKREEYPKTPLVILVASKYLRLGCRGIFFWGDLGKTLDVLHW